MVAHSDQGSDPQHPVATSLLTCLLQLAQVHRNPQSAETLTAGLPLVNSQLTPELFQRAAKRANLDTKIVDLPLADLHNNLLPAILLLQNNQGALLLEITPDGFAKIQTKHKAHTITLHDLSSLYTGKTIVARVISQAKRKISTDMPKSKRADWFWDAIKEFVPVYSEVIVASLFINVLALASPLFIMNVYDRVVPNEAAATLWVLAIGVIFAFLFDFLMRMLRTRFVDNAAKSIDARLSAEIFEQLIGLRMSARPKTIGGLANAVQAFESFREFITSTSISVIIDFPFILIFILFIAIIGGSLFWIPLTLIPIVLGISLLIQAPQLKLIKKSYELSGAKQTTLLESLVGISTIKTHNAQSAMQRKWEDIVSYSAEIGVKLRFLSAFAVNFSVFAQYMGSILIVIAGVYKIMNGGLTVGGLIACTILTGRALAPLSQIASLLMRYHQSVAGLNGLNEIMNLPVERPVGKSYLQCEKLENHIEFRNVTFTYPHSPIPAVNDISFTINPGDRIALIGKVGSGKSTIQKLILGLYQPSSGNILIDGLELQQLDPNELRRHIAYVPQDIILFSGTIKDNIVFGQPDATDDMIIRAIKLAGLDHLIAQNPDGINMQVGERGEMLSGGQRQAVAIAQALVHLPNLLIFDEPTASMDEMTENRFKKGLIEILPGKTLMLTTHKGSMVALANRIIIIDNGKIIADGPKEKVLEALKRKQVKTKPKE